MGVQDFIFSMRREHKGKNIHKRYTNMAEVQKHFPSLYYGKNIKKTAEKQSIYIREVFILHINFDIIFYDLPLDNRPM